MYIYIYTYTYQAGMYRHEHTRAAADARTTRECASVCRICLTCPQRRLKSHVIMHTMSHHHAYMSHMPDMRGPPTDLLVALATALYPIPYTLYPIPYPVPCTLFPVPYTAYLRGDGRANDERVPDTRRRGKAAQCMTAHPHCLPAVRLACVSG